MRRHCRTWLYLNYWIEVFALVSYLMRFHFIRRTALSAELTFGDPRSLWILIHRSVDHELCLFLIMAYHGFLHEALDLKECKVMAKALIASTL